jgi:hypothetical protein
MQFSINKGAKDCSKRFSHKQNRQTAASKHLSHARNIQYLGDDVAVPALGQTNFLLFLFGWFFILFSSATLLVYLDLRFLTLPKYNM